MDDPIFTTRRLSTRPWSPADVEWYLDVLDDEIIRWTREPSDVTEEMWQAAREASSRGETVRTVAVMDGNGLPVGNLGLRRHADSYEFFYWISPGARGSGRATELLGGAVEWARRSLAPTVVELQIHPDNLASIRVAEHVGFRFDGYREASDACADEQGRVAVYTLAV
jgi:RimJ/RimL family protein N-acetyltransferase